MDFLLEHWDAIFGLLTAVVALVSRWRVKGIAQTIIEGVEIANDPRTKQIIASVARESGREKSVDRLVQKTT